MPKISRIEPTVPAIKQLKKVAAYARVSMQSERMMHSLSAQVSYYSKLIQKNPDWEYAGVYADDFISGTNTVKRDEFKRMLADCEEGKIDIILTKSISRFARNTVDLLETVRDLKAKGIEVRFEKENINSMSGDGELMLSILASFAQEESRSISENIRWATKNRFEQGIPNGKFRIFGYRWDGDQLKIEPTEAVIVKRIFQNFLDGKSRLETEKEFAAEGVTTANGCRWVDSNIKVVLTNITYTGNLLLQKEFIEDPITKHRKKNRGEMPQYFVENTHEPIIDMETFQYVQDEIARRKELGALANKSLNICCFTGKIKCPHCGVSYMHNKRTDRGNCLEFWSCGSSKKKGGHCEVGGSINHKNLKKACAEVLGLEEFDEETFLREVDHIDVPKRYVLEFYMADGRAITKDCPNTGHKDCWTAEYRAKTSAKRKKNGTNCKGSSGLTGKIKCKNCGCNFRRATQPSATAESGKVNYWRCSEHSNGCQTAGLREDALIPLLTDALGMAEFDDAVFRKAVDYISVLMDTDLEIHKKDGTVMTVVYAPPSRKHHPRTEEQKAHMRSLMKERWTPERKAEMSERMKQMRKGRGKNWRKEK